MMTHEFYGKYANTTIPARETNITIKDKLNEYYPGKSALTLNDIYEEVDRIEREMHPLRLQQHYLIEAAEQTILDNQAGD